MRENTYNKEDLLLGIRRSLRDEAAAMLTRLGETATIDSMLDMYHSALGNTQTPEYILKKFMSVSRNQMNSLFHMQVELRNYSI